ncbi:MAG: SprT family zinc-dependent metalloprotease [Leptolyngbyaceae cyanobacterium bins.302]|nr:SprT family zinc-dependent metalloprotease [Leptolyngbyaceae cyanobacterium bins.302]
MSPDYTIRESSKAKHVSLKMSITGDLEVIVPKGFDQKRVPEILRSKQRWIERVVQRMAAQQSLAGAEVSTERPNQITLQAIAETWAVEYQPTAQATIQLIEKPRHRLILKGNTNDIEHCKAALQQWIAHKARLHLPSWLQSVSKEAKLPFEQVSIRKQKTIWGSCSIRKTISLNSKLLFLPSPLVRYVLVHELCHTIHLNHSRDFWSLVGKHEPDYRTLDASLRDARYLVPWWMEQ